MIPLTLGQAITLYVGGLVAFLLFLSLVRMTHRLWSEARARRSHIRCALCGTLYENASPDPLPPCPGCGHPNERRPAGGV